MQNPETNSLGEFYESWSAKSVQAIVEDIAAAQRKADVLASMVPLEVRTEIHTLLDFGCGFGGVLNGLLNAWDVDRALGVDFSESAIAEARRRFVDARLGFQRLPSLDTDVVTGYLKQLLPEGVNCILLVDLLEHVPDCERLVAALAPLTKYFVIKLPVESSIVDNYILPKEYPSSRHSNGHLREFDANSVHYFIRQLGLTPLRESLYVYELRDIFPAIPAGAATLKRRIIRRTLWLFKGMARMLLPKRIFMRLIGGGGYVCLATYDAAHVLRP